LIGYNDKTEEEKRIMKTKEDLYIDEVDFSEIEI
jgi:ssRNA-specific RNase YbeY (16S rRNA maturation enzyme)